MKPYDSEFESESKTRAPWCSQIRLYIHSLFLNFNAISVQLCSLVDEWLWSSSCGSGLCLHLTHIERVLWLWLHLHLLFALKTFYLLLLFILFFFLCSICGKEFRSHTAFNKKFWKLIIHVQSFEFVAKHFTVLVYCGLSIHMIIHTHKLELKWHSLQDY